MEPMNFLIITSDQHSKRVLGCYGNEFVKTPNLDQLAAEGVRFDAAYCNSPICVPARAAFATGRYASSCGYWDNAHAFDGACASWGTRLTEAGRRVVTIGKLHYKNEDPQTGFPEQRIPLNIKNGVGDIYGSIRDKEITRYQFRDALQQASAGESDYIRYDRAIADRSAAFLRREAVNESSPWALHIGFVTPHFPLVVPRQYLDLYPDRKSVRRPIEFCKEDWNSHPVVDDYRRYCGSEQIDEQTAWNAIRTYYAMCTFMDEQVGVVMQALRDSGLDKTTRIIYTSDHGDTMGDHGVYFKSTMYEGSAAVPFIAAGPDLPKNAFSDTVVSLVDIFPTALECTGVPSQPADADLPGTSIWKFARGKYDPDRVAFSEYYAQGVYTAMFLLRKGRYKYVYYVGERPQLFDVAGDPKELHDLAGKSEYAAIQKELDAELRRIVDPEQMERESKQAQHRLLEKHGGKEGFLATFMPALFSPIPDLG